MVPKKDPENAPMKQEESDTQPLNSVFREILARCKIFRDSAGWLELFPARPKERKEKHRENTICCRFKGQRLLYEDAAFYYVKMQTRSVSGYPCPETDVTFRLE